MINGGLYIGDDRKTGKEIVIDFDKLPAKHICMFGNGGAGKIVVGYSTTHKTSNLIENTHILRSG